MTEHKNDMTNLPAAACRRCGGWTTQGGMSQYSRSAKLVMNRTGCDCHDTLTNESPYGKK